MYIADLHIHSKYSRATSKELEPEPLDAWARRKGIGLVGTGDFTHPAWRAELRDKLAKEQGELPAASAGVTVSDDHLRIPEDKVAEASAALAVLGYTQGEINLALKGIDLDSLTLEQIIKAALKKMMKQ